jgi:hypothetical protein
MRNARGSEGQFMLGTNMRSAGMYGYDIASYLGLP